MTDTETTTAGEPSAIPPVDGYAAAGPRRNRRWPIVLSVLVILLGVGVFILGKISVNYYAITPGDASPVTPYIKVPAHLDHKLNGQILLTDVFVTPLNALTYLQERYFSSDAEVISTPDLLGPATPADQFVAQGYLQMAQAQSAAVAAALSHLGYNISARNAGALVYGVGPGTPAAKVLKVAQVVTAINGKPTLTSCALIGALDGLQPGAVAILTVEKSTISSSGVFEAGPSVKEPITLGTPAKGDVDNQCGTTIKPTAFLGVSTETQFAWDFPVKVSVHTTNIGGPSAGLSMTLGIIDKLSGGHLTGNRTVAATGTIDAQGNVGDVGGVREKTIAVERAGATVFLVPPQEYKVALSEKTPGLKVYAVSTLDQALKILKRLGGTLPVNHQVAHAAP
ncbi:MAG TPA: S16 family serine protease [Acidimicrobiales bacterium]|jgi:PDZ domain-containing protein|nr:S16 family serine protease [Acidimicrobiales bacterium]